jgi:DNA-binding beta-propeller fold protein YncE
MRCLVAVPLLSVLAAEHLVAQDIPEVPRAFQNSANQTFTPGQLLFRQTGLGRITNIAYHNGLLYTNVVTGGDRRRFRWADPDDIRSLVNDWASPDIPSATDQGNHAHTKIGDWLGGAWGMDIRRIAPGENAYSSGWPRIHRHPDWLGHQGGHGIYWPWNVSFNWIQYRGNSSEDIVTFIGRQDEVLHVWDSLAEHGVTGNHILMGNILLVVSDESKLGLLSYDISPVFETPSRPPILLDKLSGALGAYIGVLWKNLIVLARRDTNSVDIVDWSDPANLRFVKSIDVRGTTGWDFQSNVPYAQAQDEFVFTRRHKINMETLTPVLEFDEVGDNRPPGSEAGPLETSQYMMPLGPYVVTGSYSVGGGGDGLGVWAHQSGPDNRPPTVAWHIPRDGQTNFPVRAPISVLIHETLESYTMVNGVSVIIRPRGGEPVDAWISFAHDDIMTITPKQPLETNTTYDVVIPEGGIKDAAGNGITGYSFSFSTGSDIAATNLPPVIDSIAPSEVLLAAGQEFTLSVAATDPDGDSLEYRFSFSDEPESREWSTSPQVLKSFSADGRYLAKVQVRDARPDGTSSVSTDSITLTAAPTPTGPLPTKSSSVAIDSARGRVWVVHPDNEFAAAFETSSGNLHVKTNLAAALEEPKVDPRSIAVAANGEVWIACHDADRIAVLDGETGALRESIYTGYGSAPATLAVTRDGSTILATLTGRGATNPENGQLVRFSTATRSETGRLELGPWPHAIAITGDASRAFVTRFFSEENRGAIWDVNLSGNMSITRTILLPRDRGDRGFDSAGGGKGVPNHVAAIAISPDNANAWFVAKKDQTQRGAFFAQGLATAPTNQELTPDHTVRAMLGRIDMATGREPNATTFVPLESSRVDIDNSEGPMDIEFSPRGDYAFIALQGNNEVAVFDLLAVLGRSTRTTTWRFPAGEAPRGLAFGAATGSLWVHNFLGRDLTRHELGNFLASGSRRPSSTSVSTEVPESLTPAQLRGKKLFYSASDAMSLENYMSCASCHFDGGQDGRVFDFTQRGEGLRNTTDLRGRAGTAHGNVHWTANFDEIQDFTIDIIDHFGGRGFLPAEDFNSEPLGKPHTGRSADLEDLAAYVSSLGNDALPKSPHRNADGSRTAEAVIGQQVFVSNNCIECHAPPTYTNSRDASTLQNVGTLRTGSGSRLFQTLEGIDTPTLLGVWATAPYFHDGQAATLDEVFSVAGGTVVQAESGTLSGNATVPPYIEINWDASVRGRLVEFPVQGSALELTGIDGGLGGTGAVEIRFQTRHNATMQVEVNGVARTVPLPIESTNLEWRRVRLENITLEPGTANTIRISNAGTHSFAVDDLVVTTADNLALADPHRRVLAIPSTERGQLLAYLRQLDGRDASGMPLNSPPFAAIAVSPKSIRYGDGHSTTITLDARASTDPDGDALSVEWTVPDGEFIEGTSASSPVARVVLPGSESITISLEVSDPSGATNRALHALGVVDSRPGATDVSGLNYEYHEILNMEVLPDFASLTPKKTGRVLNFDLSPRDRDENFALRFHGFLRIDRPALYTFYTTSDDGSSLSINGALVVDNDGLHGATTRSGTIFLEAGRHEISVGFFDRTSVHSLVVEYSAGHMPRQVIPSEVLSYREPDPPRSLARAMFDEWVERHTTLDGHLVDPGTVLAGDSASLLSRFLRGRAPGETLQSAVRFELPGSDRVRFVLDRIRTAPGLTHRLETSTNLVDWDPADHVPEVEFAAPGFQRWTFDLPAEPDTPRQFLRVRSSMSE